MVFCKEENRRLLRSLKNLVRRDREAGEYVPESFDRILQSLDEMSAKNDESSTNPATVDAAAVYGPGRKEYEILQAYNSLVDAGGRPICPLGDTNHISKDPEKYLDILIPWIGNGSGGDLDWKEIFDQQLLNWQRFRAWQRAHRDGSGNACHARASKTSPLADEVHSESSSGGSSAKTRFEIHVESTKKRLTHCGFTKSFCFDFDTEMQDDWTTWIEYLSFELCCFDDCSRYWGKRGWGDVAVATKFNCTGGYENQDDLAQSQSVDCDVLPNGASFDDDNNNNNNNNTKYHDVDSHFASEKTNGRINKNKAACLHINPALEVPEDSRTWKNASRISNAEGKIGDGEIKLNAAEHHNLILKWALLQEPEIAAMCVERQAAGSVRKTASSMPSSRRLKRYRDGSMCTSTSKISDATMACASDEFDTPETKRCRGSG